VACRVGRSREGTEWESNDPFGPYFYVVNNNSIYYIFNTALYKRKF